MALPLESIPQDLRFAVRQLRRYPGFAATAILVLAPGIAASLAIFAFVDAALLEPLPYRNPSRLAVAYETTDDCGGCNLSYPDYLDWKKASSAFSSFEAWEASVYLWPSPDGVQVRCAHVTGGFFQTLGVSALIGRVLTNTDDRPAAPRAVVLTYDAWQNRFGGRQDIVGQSLILDNASFSVIGVLPREFQFALRAAVCRLILGQAGFVAAVGVGFGLGCSIPAARLLRGLLFGVQPWDAPTLISVALMLGIWALLASYLPARRAASVNPIKALRAE